jgi:hypothetical protein
VIALQNRKLYPHPKDEPGTTACASFAAAKAAKFRGCDIAWELWNEPNTKTFWGAHGRKGNSEAYAGEYLRLIRKTVPAMKQADPDCVILGGSVSNLWEKSYQWMGYCFAQGILKTDRLDRSAADAKPRRNRPAQGPYPGSRFRHVADLRVVRAGGLDRRRR